MINSKFKLLISSWFIKQYNIWDNLDEIIKDRQIKLYSSLAILSFGSPIQNLMKSQICFPRKKIDRQQSKSFGNNNVCTLTEDDTYLTLCIRPISWPVSQVWPSWLASRTIQSWCCNRCCCCRPGWPWPAALR